MMGYGEERMKRAQEFIAASWSGTARHSAGRDAALHGCFVQGREEWATTCIANCSTPVRLTWWAGPSQVLVNYALTEEALHDVLDRG